jgi:hypothetical protein
MCYDVYHKNYREMSKNSLRYDKPQFFWNIFVYVYIFERTESSKVDSILNSAPFCWKLIIHWIWGFQPNKYTLKKRCDINDSQLILDFALNLNVSFSHQQSVQKISIGWWTWIHCDCVELLSLADCDSGCCFSLWSYVTSFRFLSPKFIAIHAIREGHCAHCIK